MLKRVGQPLSRRQRGMSIVEMMVGVAVGLIVLAGGLVLLSSFTTDNRRLLQETRLMQDLRAASDLVTRDLRRAGYWSAASTGVWTDTTTSVSSNTYRFMYGEECDAAALGTDAATPSSATSKICYKVNTSSGTELYGFTLASDTLYAFVGGTRQALTDPKTITITNFVVTPSSQTIDARSYCHSTCTGTNCPRVVVREFEVLIKGTVPNDPTIQRSLRSNVRVRNDYYDGVCS